MTGNSSATEARPASAFVITREFDAPRDLVWKAHSEAERLKQWWGPKGFAMAHCTLDFRPGGIFHYALRSPNGQEMWGRFAYREIAPREKIVFASSFSDPDGAIVRAPFSETCPLEFLNTLTLFEHDGRTTLTITVAPINADDAEMATFESMRDSMRQGFGGTFDQLAAHLAKDTASSAR
ncbi:MAG TPA: SRPBCC domain-containing protein [Armatimonadota bacterium]|jgi:uncharacterized protein YndB with AHSA1/START domain